ncbi:MAG: glycoside hydrolase family 3 N-terminal domain-containing protein [Pyrinomonadaceae bacterium]
MVEDIHSLSLSQQVGQLFCIGIAGAEIDSDTGDVLTEVAPGGICLFARNIRERQQTRDLLEALRYFVPVVPMLTIDQEGGLVDRLRRVMSPMPAASRLRTVDDARKLGSITAESLRILGFNTNFAPVVDVIDGDRARHSNGLFSREFGRSVTEVVDLAGGFLRSLQDEGIVGCMKHFPGLGASRVDSHEELPLVGIGENEFHDVDLHPYRELFRSGSARCVMVAHAAFPELSLQEIDKNGKLLPSSLSYNLITTLLRDELGFSGLVITDDLEMGAIVKNYGIGEASKMAINAGCDMVAICADQQSVLDGYRAVLAAAKSGEIDRPRLVASLDRIAAFKRHFSSPLPFDLRRLDQLSREVVQLSDRLMRS